LPRAAPPPSLAQVLAFAALGRLHRASLLCTRRGSLPPSALRRKGTVMRWISTVTSSMGPASTATAGHNNVHHAHGPLSRAGSSFTSSESKDASHFSMSKKEKWAREVASDGWARKRICRYELQQQTAQETSIIKLRRNKLLSLQDAKDFKTGKSTVFLTRPNNLSQFWHWIKQALPGGETAYTEGLAAICWAIWKARSKAYFDKVMIKHPCDIILHTCSFLRICPNEMGEIIKAGA
ncbi:hypothetical protein EJB05_12677, partial [Eragrostis curvula]